MHRRLIAAIKMFVLVCFTFGNTLAVQADHNPLQYSGALQINPADVVQTTLLVPASSNLQNAINSVPNGGVIEIAAGSYNSPSGGWRINDPNKHFTIRAAQGAAVTLSGANATDILRYTNNSNTTAGSVVFENLTFSSGYTNSLDVAAGITIFKGYATFIGCVAFLNNKANNGRTVGGAVYVKDNSTVFFFNTTFDGNTSTFGGAAVGVRIHSKVYFNNDRFTNNHTNVSGHVTVAPGGGINAADSIVRVSNSRFEGNQVAGHGAGLYALGTKNDAWRTDVLVANTLFLNNRAIGDSSFQGEGGGINVEDNTTIRVYNSRFITNTANIGGGANDYRAQMNIYNSAFLGNQASDPGDNSSAFGGAISVNSDDDNTGDGYAPNAVLDVEDTYFQGRYGSVGVTARSGGCLHTKGNEIGMGTNVGAAQNYRATVTLRRDVFNDCNSSGTSLTWAGGLEILLTNLVMEDSFVANSDISNGDGGGMVVTEASTADIARTYLVHNSASHCGGAMYLYGAAVNLHESVAAQNIAKTGANFWDSCGGFLYTVADTGRNLGVSGSIQNNHLSQNTGVSIYEYDTGSPSASRVVFNGNVFSESSFGANSDYWMGGPHLVVSTNAAGLNSLVSPYGVDKSTQNNNSDLGSPYIFGAIRAVPSVILSSGANGESGPTPAYFGYVWSGASATYNGSSVAGYAGASGTTSAGTSTLKVNGANYQATVAVKAGPAATLQNVCSPTSYDLSWNVSSGTLLDVAIDRGVSIPANASGTVSVSAPLGTDYHLYAITQEGGVMVEAMVGNPLLDVPNSVDFYADSGSNLNYRTIPVKNSGTCTLDWSASTSNPNLISVVTQNGATNDIDQILLSLAKQPNGTYSGLVTVDAGAAGNKAVTVNIHYITMPFRAFLPSIKH